MTNRGSDPGDVEPAELDPRLLAAFRRATPALAADDAAFVERIGRQVQRQRRRRALAYAAARIAALLCVGIGLSGLLHAAPRIVDLLSLASADSVTPMGDWLLTPAGWSISLLLALAVLWRSRAFRR